MLGFLFGFSKDVVVLLGFNDQGVLSVSVSVSGW